MRLHFRDAEMEPAGVPALLAYRAGEKFAGLVPLIQEMPDDADLSAGTLEWLLKRYGIAPPFVCYLCALEGRLRRARHQILS